MIEANETSKELLKLGEHDKEIAAYANKANYVPDVSTEEGYKQSKKTHKEGRKLWNALDKARVEIKKEPLRVCRLIDSTTNEYKERVEIAYKSHGDAVKEKDEEEQRQKDAAAAAFQEQVDYRLEEIRCLSNGGQNMESLKSSLITAKGLKFESGSWCKTYGSKLSEARKVAVDVIGRIEAAIKSEQDRLDVAEEKERLAEQAKEQEAQQAKIDAEREAEAARIAKENAEIEKKRKAEQAKIDAENAKKQAVIDSENERRQKEIDEAEAAQKKERLRREEEIKAHEAEQASAKAALDKEIADKDEADRIAAQAPDKEKMIAYVLSLRAVHIPEIADKKCLAYLNKIDDRLLEFKEACEKI